MILSGVILIIVEDFSYSSQFVIECDSSQTSSILDATLLLYAVFIDLNRFWLFFVCWFSWYIASSYFFHMRILLLIISLFVPLLYSLLSTLLYLRLLRAFQWILNRLAARRSGKRSSSVNEVNARRDRLQLGWVTVFGRVYHLGL